MSKNEIYNLLIRYLDHELSQEESAIVESLLHNNEWAKNEYALLKKLNTHIENYPGYQIDSHVNDHWASLQSQIQPKNKTLTWPTLLKYSAAAVIVFISAWLLLKPSGPSFEQFSEGKVFRTQKNEIKTVVLSDGSRITLQQNSSIAIDQNYNLNERLISLSGTAYFEVAKNGQKDFIVSSNHTLTQAIGTAFVIDNRNINQMAIALLKGKVRFMSNGSSDELKPGDLLNYNLKNSTFSKSRSLSEKAFAWKNGLDFKDAKLSYIADVLESIYPIHFVLDRTKANELYTTSFQGLDLEGTLSLLEELTEAKISRNGSDYIINP